MGFNFSPAGCTPRHDQFVFAAMRINAHFDEFIDNGRQAVDRVVESVDLGSHRDQVVGRLSGGQRSRASLAVALLGEPDLLVLDEPTVGLDPVLREDLWALFHELAERGTAVFVSSHVMDEAERCDRLLLMREGRIIADTSPGGRAL